MVEPNKMCSNRRIFLVWTQVETKYFALVPLFRLECISKNIQPGWGLSFVVRYDIYYFIIAYYKTQLKTLADFIIDFSLVSDNATMQNICLVANADSFKYFSEKLFELLTGSVYPWLLQIGIYSSVIGVLSLL